jgi:hypothetical protein
MRPAPRTRRPRATMNSSSLALSVSARIFGDFSKCFHKLENRKLKMLTF